MEKMLTDAELRMLRTMGAITSDEVAYRVGDLVVAENVLTKARRTLTESVGVVSESSKELLKG